MVEAATAADGVPPLSEQVRLRLRPGGQGPDRHLLLTDPMTGELLGYAHLDPSDIVEGPVAELVVHPSRRGRGYGHQLVKAALDAATDDRLRLWAHGAHPAARAVASRLGLHEIRRLEQWRRSLSTSFPCAPLPPGVRLRAFSPGEDDDAWLALNARAFAGHPEQGSWTARDLRARMARPWFDPAGFLLAEETAETGRLLGFHWTKIHETSHQDHVSGRGQIGEVYIVGVDPLAQGLGLGRALTVAGLTWLRSRGLSQAMLYVESDNARALATYSRLGFAHWDTDVMFGPSRHQQRHESEPAPGQGTPAQ